MAASADSNLFGSIISDPIMFSAVCAWPSKSTSALDHIHLPFQKETANFPTWDDVSRHLIVLSIYSLIWTQYLTHSSVYIADSLAVIFLF